MSEKKGLIVCFDGPDGVGKTTQLKLAKQSLESNGFKVFTAKAVGGLPLTDLLGQALMLNAERPVETDLYIAIAGQYALADEVIKHKNQGEIVLLDRSPLSIIAYQVYADGLDKAKGEEAVKDLLQKLSPDLILTYYADEGVAKKRLIERNGEAQRDYFESKPDSYHQLTAEGFREAAKRFDAIEIDANAPIELVREATMQHIGTLLQA